MRGFWRNVPALALPVILGLGAAYLATGFAPRPKESLRPPEELRASGLAYAEESPERAVLERNVLNLESAPFSPPGPSVLSDAPPLPAAADDGTARPKPLIMPPQAGFAPLEPTVTPAVESVVATAPLAGRVSVRGRTVAPPQTTVAPGLNVATPRATTARRLRNAAKTDDLDHAAPPEGFQLVGVIAGGDRPVAMLQVDGAAVTLRPGESVHGWTLASVLPDAVLLRRGAQTRRLPLKTQ